MTQDNMTVAVFLDRIVTDTLIRLHQERDEAREWARRMKRERDEASMMYDGLVNRVAELDDATADWRYENEKLRRALAKVIKERDAERLLSEERDLQYRYWRIKAKEWAIRYRKLSEALEAPNDPL